jgi:Rps23 Pro-64 3,4-dihydroxylase Tpa1-like proline 4-hydroxylase
MYIPVELEEVPVVVIDNFLPKDYIESLFSDIENLKPFFGKSKWTTGVGTPDEVQEKISHNCTGEDLWLPFELEEDDKNEHIGDSIINLYQYFYHTGIREFLRHCKSPELNCYSKYNYNCLYHLINYKSGGYYNWHQDSNVSGMSWAGFPVDKQTTFTFALTLLKDESLISGGEQLFMKDGKIVSIESKNNRLVIFPSDVYHAVTEITMDENTEWINRRFNLQAWLCHL